MSKDLIQRLLNLAEQAVDEALCFEYGDYTQREIYKTLQELKPLAKQALSTEPQKPTDENGDFLTLHGIALDMLGTLKRLGIIPEIIDVLGRAIREPMENPWVEVAKELPDPSKKVLAHYKNDLGNGRTVIACYVPAKTRSGGYDEEFAEYDEDADKYYWPEGWYECVENCEELDCLQISEFKVTHWRPLPIFPVSQQIPAD